MIKKIQMSGIDCANCASKMESAIKRIPGVNDASISFLSQKLILNVEDKRYDTVIVEAAKVCKKIEPDCEMILK